MKFTLPILQRNHINGFNIRFIYATKKRDKHIVVRSGFNAGYVSAKTIKAFNKWKAWY